MSNMKKTQKIPKMSAMSPARKSEKMVKQTLKKYLMPKCTKNWNIWGCRLRRTPESSWGMRLKQPEIVTTAKSPRQKGRNKKISENIKTSVLKNVYGCFFNLKYKINMIVYFFEILKHLFNFNNLK